MDTFLSADDAEKIYDLLRSAEPSTVYGSWAIAYPHHVRTVFNERLRLSRRSVVASGEQSSRSDAGSWTFFTSRCSGSNGKQKMKSVLTLLFKEPVSPIFPRSNIPV